MNALISVMVGGALGAGARFGVGQWLGSPWATLVVNLSGGLAMGLLIGTLARGFGKLAAVRGSRRAWRVYDFFGVRP